MVSTASRRTLAALVATALAVVLFVSTNLAAQVALQGLRFDLTEDRLFTLDPATREVLAAIDEPVTLRLYFSQRIAEAAPGLAAYAGRVRERLEEYALAAPDRIQLEVYDPEPFSDEEDRAVAYGLAGVPLTPGGELTYFGIAGTNAVDDEETIPFLQPEREGELDYELTRMLARLARPDRTRVGLVGTLPILGGTNSAGQPLPPFAIYRQLLANAEMVPVALDDLAARGPAALDPADLDVLLLVHPRDLPPASLYAVDQFLMRGGRAVVFVDPNSEAETVRRPPPEMLGPAFSTLGPFAASWGVDLVGGRVVGDRDTASEVTAQSDGRTETVDYVAWLGLGAANRDPQDRITAHLGRVTLGTAGILTPRTDATTRLMPLLFTGPDAMAVDAALVGFRPNPQQLLADYRPGGTPLVMAARVRGPAGSAFPDGPPEGVEAADGHVAETAGLDLVVVADTDLLDDVFWLRAPSEEGAPPQAFAENDAFVINAIEALAGTIDLSALRGRAGSARPFTRIAAIAQAAADRYRDTEAALQARLDEFQREMETLQSGGGAGTAVFSAEQRDAIEAIRTRMVETRRELREVQRALRQDVERIESRLTLANIAAVPLLVALLAIAIAVINAVRRRRAVRLRGAAR